MSGYHLGITLLATLSSASVDVRYPATSPVTVGPAWSYFTTPDPPEQVVSHFADHWRRLGVPVSVDRHRDGSAVVSAFFTREGLQQAVVAMRSPSGTLAFRLERRLDGAPALPTDGAGAVGFDDALSRAGPSNGSGLWPVPLEEAQRRWGRILERAGYRSDELASLQRFEDFGVGKRQVTLRHRQAGREVWTHLVEVQPGLTAWVLLPMGGAAILEASAP